MIYRILYALLYGSSAIRDRVATRIFPENAPQGTRGACIIMRQLSGSAEAHLLNECDCAMPLVQIDFYDESPVKAETGYQLVRNLLSGYTGAVSHLDADGDLTTTLIHECSLRRPGMATEEPGDGSDKWVYRHTADFELFHEQSVPTHV